MLGPRLEALKGRKRAKSKEGGQHGHDRHATIAATAITKHTRRGGSIFAAALIAFGVLVLCAPWINIPRDQADSAGMLAHLHAYFIDGDLLYDDEYARLGMSPLFAFVTGEGVVSNHWPAGATWLQLPGFALGLTAARVLEASGIGHASPLGVVVVLGIRTWAMLVMLGIAAGVAAIVARAAAQGGARRPRAIGGAVAAAFVVGTPLLYYAAEAPLRPHLWGAAVTMGAVALWSRPSLGTPALRAVVLGAVVGLASYVRPQLAPLGLLVVHDLWRSSSGQGRRRVLGLALLGLLAWPLMHLRTQWWMYGDGLSSYAGEVSHHLRAFLLSTHHGALTWCPVLGIGAFAVARSAWRREPGSWLILGLLLHQVWLDAGARPIEPQSVLGTRTWAGGTGFAARKLVDVLPLLVPAVASLVRDGVRARWGRPLLALAAASCLPTLMLHLSAVLAPEATTGALVDAAGLRSALGRAGSATSWSVGLAPRALPVAVPLTVAAVVGLPLLLVMWRVIRAVRDAEPVASLRVLGACLLGGAVVAQVWLTVVLVRSDAALAGDPERMQRAAARMHPPHHATVARIADHHATMARVLGRHTVP